MTRGQQLAHAISFALIGASKVVRGMWKTLTDEERSAVADRAVSQLKDHGDQWRLNEEVKLDPLHGAHSSPPIFTEAHRKED